NQVCYQIIGNDVTVTMAAEAGSLELNAMEPIMALNLLQSVVLLPNACQVLTEKCVKGIQADRARCPSYGPQSFPPRTRLTPAGVSRRVGGARPRLRRRRLRAGTGLARRRTPGVQPGAGEDDAPASAAGRERVGMTSRTGRPRWALALHGGAGTIRRGDLTTA